VPNPSLVRRHKGLARHSIHQLLHVDAVRFAVAWVRFTWYARIRRQLRTLDIGSGTAVNTVSHNLGGLRDLAVVRSLYLIRPLSILEEIRPDARILTIGPRTEGELLALVAHGFDRSTITAVDLISYSPWVELGDMHDLPYADNTFDVVIAGWVLAYSDDKERAAREIVRVARPGAVVAVGVEWSPQSNEDLVEALGYVPGSEARLLDTPAIFELFGDSVGEVLLRHDADHHLNLEQSLLAIFTCAQD
jgi:SAM-dependent methyltransferase